MGCHRKKGGKASEFVSSTKFELAERFFLNESGVLPCKLFLVCSRMVSSNHLYKSKTSARDSRFYKTTH